MINSAITMNMTGIYVFISGLALIIIQLILPDLVPDAIKNLLSQDISQFLGFAFVLKAFLFLWVISGYVLLLIGIVATVISFRRR